MQLEITKMKEELKEIQQKFELQTEEVIRSYQEISVHGLILDIDYFSKV